MICHGDDKGDVDGCRKCNGDSFGEGCCDSDDGVDCDCIGDVDDDGDGDVAGCGHDDGYWFMMNEIFYFRRDDIDLIPTIVMCDVLMLMMNLLCSFVILMLMIFSMHMHTVYASVFVVVMLMAVENAMVTALEKVAVIQMMMLNTIAMVVLMLMARGKAMALVLVVV